jgi:hypothetical protein
VIFITGIRSIYPSMIERKQSMAPSIQQSTVHAQSAKLEIAVFLEEITGILDGLIDSEMWMGGPYFDI